MKQDYIHMAVLLDRSGSMSSIRDAMIEGYNDFLKKQKENSTGTGSISLSRFDSVYEEVYKFEDLDKVPNLDAKTFDPRGATALNDSLFKLIKETGDQLATLAEDERPDKVLVMVITDGQENASREIPASKVSILKDAIKHQEDNYNWEFVYIGANVDIQKESTTRGISNNMSFKATASGASAGFDSLSMNVTAYRSDSSYFKRTKGKDLSALSREDIDQLVAEPVKTETKVEEKKSE